MSGREKPLLIGVIVAIVLGGAFIVLYQAPSEPAEQPWLNPPIGSNDLQYSNDTTLYGGGSLLLRLQDSLAIVEFHTHNQPILLYGSFNSPDGDIDFFLIDEEGYANLMTWGSIPANHLYDSFSDDAETWEYLLQPILNDNPVETWYVVYSAYMVSALDSRSISAMSCQDRTAPNIDFSLEDEVNESVTINFDVTETRGDISLVRLFIDDELIYQWQPFNASISPHYTWNTENYTNGEHWVGVYVEDRLGNARATWLNTSIANYYPPFEIPAEINYNITLITILLTFFISIFVTCFKGSKIGITLLSFILMILGIIGFTSTDYQPGPYIDFGLTFISGLGIILSIYSIYSGRKQNKHFDFRFDGVIEGLRNLSTKIEDEGVRGRKHTTRKTKEVRDKIEDSTEET